MKKAVLFLALSVFAVGCSSDSDDNNFGNSCNCILVYDDGRTIPTNVTDCSYDGRVLSEVIGPRYVCE